MKKGWENIYNIALTVIHIGVTYVTTAACVGRCVFYYYWDAANEQILFCIFLAAVLSIHNLVVFWGYKKNLLHQATNKILQICEWVMVAILTILLVVCNIDTFEEAVFVLPIVVFGIATLFLRNIWIKKTGNSKGAEDGTMF